MSGSVSSARLDGKVALVTGSGRGVGKAIALEFARRGANVVINYAKSSSAAEAVVEEIKSLGRESIAIRADVSDPAAIKSLFDQAVKHFGGLDIVMSNSGVEHFGELGTVTPEQFDRTFAVNTRGQFFVGQEAYTHLREGGRLIMTSSISAKARGVYKHAVYSGSKCAVEAFVRCFARDFGHRKITVNAVAPGGIKTDMYIEAAKDYIPNSQNFTDQQVDDMVKKMSVLDRVGQPQDVARVVAFLASEDGAWMTGQVMDVSGGGMA